MKGQTCQGQSLTAGRSEAEEHTVEDARVLSGRVVEEVALLLLPASLVLALAELAERSLPGAPVLAVLEDVLLLVLGKSKEHANAVIE